jgi:myo-inositol-1(or 4)-monophosphatase
MLIGSKRTGEFDSTLVALFAHCGSLPVACSGDRMPAAYVRPETAAAVAALGAALPIVLARQGAEDVRAKAARDIVTGTDLASQATIERVLRQHFPAYGFVGEEGNPVVPASGKYWLVDPLCGTANFATRLPLYAVNIALVEGGRVTIAAVGDGTTGEMYVAERGFGAWLIGSDGQERLRASAFSGLVSLDPNLAGPDDLRAFGQAFAIRVLAAGRWDVRMFATTLALPYLASGRIAGAVYAASGPRVHLAAGLLLAHESGATVTSERGTEWTLDDAVYVVAAGHELHRELLAIARSVIAELQTAPAS